MVVRICVFPAGVAVAVAVAFGGVNCISPCADEDLHSVLGNLLEEVESLRRVKQAQESDSPMREEVVVVSSSGETEAQVAVKVDPLEDRLARASEWYVPGGDEDDEVEDEADNGEQGEGGAVPGKRSDGFSVARGRRSEVDVFAEIDSLLGESRPSEGQGASSVEREEYCSDEDSLEAYALSEEEEDTGDGDPHEEDVYSRSRSKWQPARFLGEVLDALKDTEKVDRMERALQDLPRIIVEYPHHAGKTPSCDPFPQSILDEGMGACILGTSWQH